MTTSNKELYERDDVVNKYGANSTRVRSLNNPEKLLIDRYDIKNKKVLVIGGGAGRVPANLLLYGNEVVSVDRSEKLTQIARANFPSEKFPGLNFLEGDAIDLNFLEDEFFDVVMFPMNSIDYLDTKESRDKAIVEASKKLKKGGIFAFSSHNKLAYFFSPKIRMKDRKFSSFFGDFVFTNESVVGGGCIFKGNPSFVIKDTVKLTGLEYLGFLVDSRDKFDKAVAKSFILSQLYFPYFLYVFRK